MRTIYGSFVETGHFEVLRCQWKGDDPKTAPHVFWDSDIAKLMEGMSYVLMKERNEQGSASLTRRWICSLKTAMRTDSTTAIFLWSIRIVDLCCATAMSCIARDIGLKWRSPIIGVMFLILQEIHQCGAAPLGCARSSSNTRRG